MFDQKYLNVINIMCKSEPGVEDGIDLDFLYPDSETVAINFPQLRNSSSSSGSTTTSSTRNILLNRRSTDSTPSFSSTTTAEG